MELGKGICELHEIEKTPKYPIKSLIINCKYFKLDEKFIFFIENECKGLKVLARGISVVPEYELELPL